MRTPALLTHDDIVHSTIVQAIIINEREEILLKVRPKEPERYRLDFFSTFRGSQESDLMAVSRIMEDELAVHVCEDAIQYTGSILQDHARFPGKKCTIYPYLVQTLKGDVHVFGPNMKWCTKRELLIAETAFDNKDTLREINFL